jgi:hypothetical protein
LIPMDSTGLLLMKFENDSLRRLYLLKAGYPGTPFLFLPSWPHGHPVQHEET